MAILGVMAVFVSATSSYRRGIDGTEAALLATNVISRARAAFRDGAGLPRASAEKVPERPRYFCSIEYVDLDGFGDEVFMRVSVSWNVRGRGRSVSFDTILLRKLE